MNQLQINQQILLTIKRLGINGEGIGYYKRLAVFVDNAIPGEVVEVRITETKDKYAIGEVVQFREKSPERITPPCQYFGECGGCQIQHMSYPEQLRQKQLLIVEAFDRYYEGDLRKIKFFETLGMETPWGYRNKSSLPVRHDGKKVVVGMYAKNSNHLVYIDKSIVESELITSKRQEILDVLNRSNVDIYNPRYQSGSLKYIVIRGFEETNEIQVTFVMTNPDRKLIDILRRLDVTSANYSINNDPKSIEIFGREVINVAGKKNIAGKLGDLNFDISPSAFFQLNSKQTLVLYDEIRKAAKLTGKEKVLDVYCGIGSIGMMLAKNAQEVRGIDINREAIADANRFARINQIGNASFYAGNILPYMGQFERDGFIPDVVIVDPPRKGLDLNFINYLKKSKIKHIVYASCNPSTLAKNINHLKKEYSVKFVKPIDMFPQTASVESVTLLERR